MFPRFSGDCINEACTTGERGRRKLDERTRGRSSAERRPGIEQKSTGVLRCEYVCLEASIVCMCAMCWFHVWKHERNLLTKERSRAQHLIFSRLTCRLLPQTYLREFPARYIGRIGVALVQSGPANPDGTHNTSKLPRIGSRTFRILEAKDNVSCNRLEL